MSSDFKSKLAMFQKRASGPDPNTIPKPKYINQKIDKTKMLNKLQQAQEEQKQKNENKKLISYKTEALLSTQYNSNKVKNFLGILANKKKDEEEKNNQIKKEIQEEKKVDNTAILNRIKQAKENKYKNEQDKLNEIMKKNEEENNFTFDINQTLENINNRNNYMNYDTEKASENIKKNTKLVAQIDDNLKKIFGDELNKKNLTFEQKYHYFDRKINNHEDKEKINLIVTIKNPKPEYEYSSKIYDENKTLIAESDKQKGEVEIILHNNLVIDYIFSKKTSHRYEIIKTIQDQKEIKSEMNIPLNNILSAEENKNYEEKIDNFNDDEKINIGFEANENINNDESEKDIQLFFETKKEGEFSSNVISYSIQKDNKIIYKSPLCNCSNIKQSDKLPLSLLSPEFEISFL